MQTVVTKRTCFNFKFQLFTEEVPYSHLSESEFFMEVLNKGVEPSWRGRPEDCSARGLVPEMWI